MQDIIIGCGLTHASSSVGGGLHYPHVVAVIAYDLGVAEVPVVPIEELLPGPG